MEHIDVEGVALDPLAAVQQPAQVAQRAVHRHAQASSMAWAALIW